MRIAFIKTKAHISVISGVQIQCLMWKEGLEKLGHNVVLIDLWSKYDWNTFDVVFLFEMGESLRPYVDRLKQTVSHIVCAPIIDTITSPVIFRMGSYLLGSDRLNLTSKYYDFRKIKKSIKLYYVRSIYEKDYLIKAFGIPEDLVEPIPLSYRMPVPTNLAKKENFCFHASRLAHKTKNVSRLISAAKKYGFKLVLAGKLTGKDDECWLHNQIANLPNVKYVGCLSEEELVDYYMKAKVFALPSIQEGVGMVALEASLYGCEIVITKLGGPKEYYFGKAFEVDPYDVDDIGMNVLKAMDANNQPDLAQKVAKYYSVDYCMKLLSDSLIRLISK